jgi:hypothetical protein
MLHQTGQLNGQLIQPGVFFCEKLCVKVLFFATGKTKFVTGKAKLKRERLDY